MDEREGGQFSIFGAGEEKVCMDFGGKLWLPQSSANLSKAHVAVRRRTGQRKIWKSFANMTLADCAQTVHRKCRKAG
jgi:hypothetical protein